MSVRWNDWGPGTALIHWFFSCINAPLSEKLKWSCQNSKGKKRWQDSQTAKMSMSSTIRMVLLLLYLFHVCCGAGNNHVAGHQQYVKLVNDHWQTSEGNCSCFTLTGESGSGDRESSVTHLACANQSCVTALKQADDLSRQQHVTLSVASSVRTGSASKTRKRKCLSSSNWAGCHEWPGQESTVFVPCVTCVSPDWGVIRVRGRMCDGSLRSKQVQEDRKWVLLSFTFRRWPAVWSEKHDYILLVKDNSRQGPECRSQGCVYINLLSEGLKSVIQQEWQYLEVGTDDASEQMSIPGVSVLFAGDNWNWPCPLDLSSPVTVHLTTGNRGAKGVSNGRRN